jgi:hypothetical protein
MKKLKLQKSNKTALIDTDVYEVLLKDERLQRISFFDSLREHSEGYVVCQKSKKIASNKYETETFYLHKVVAERFLVRPESEEELIVNIKNRNRLDCRLENLEWVTVSIAARRSQRKSATGYRGVSREGKRFRASIYYNKKRIHIGMFATIEEAVAAYNQKSIELFGEVPDNNKRVKQMIPPTEREAAE